MRRERNSSNAKTSCFTLRAKRSNRQTTTTSKSPRRASAMSASNPHQRGKAPFRRSSAEGSGRLAGRELGMGRGNVRGQYHSVRGGAQRARETRFGLLPGTRNPWVSAGEQSGGVADLLYPATAGAVASDGDGSSRGLAGVRAVAGVVPKTHVIFRGRLRRTRVQLCRLNHSDLSYWQSLLIVIYLAQVCAHSQCQFD